MSWAFTHARRVIELFLSGPGVAYGLVPLAASEILYTLLGWLVYRARTGFGLSPNPIAQIFQLTQRQMALLQIPAHPLMAVADTVLFSAATYGFGRLLRIEQLSVRRVLVFFLFLWGTFSLVAGLVDALVLFPPAGLHLDFLIYYHPLAASLGIAYLIAFINRQSGVSGWRAAALVIPVYAIVLASRVIFIS